MSKKVISQILALNSTQRKRLTPHATLVVLAAFVKPGATLQELAELTKLKPGNVQLALRYLKAEGLNENLDLNGGLIPSPKLAKVLSTKYDPMTKVKPVPGIITRAIDEGRGFIELDDDDLEAFNSQLEGSEAKVTDEAPPGALLVVNDVAVYPEGAAPQPEPEAEPEAEDDEPEPTDSPVLVLARENLEAMLDLADSDPKEIEQQKLYIEALEQGLGVEEAHATAFGGVE